MRAHTLMTVVGPHLEQAPFTPESRIGYPCDTIGVTLILASALNLGWQPKDSI